MISSFAGWVAYALARHTHAIIETGSLPYNRGVLSGIGKVYQLFEEMPKCPLADADCKDGLSFDDILISIDVIHERQQDIVNHMARNLVEQSLRG